MGLLPSLRRAARLIDPINSGLRRIAFTLLLAAAGPVFPLAAEEVPLTQCDRLAADPVDYERVAPPVDDLKFLPTQAIIACREAVAAYPDTSRFRFQLGRALLALGDVDEARAALQTAGDDGYAVANLYLGRSFVSGPSGEVDYARAFDHYLLAAEQGHQDAQIAIGLMYRDGRGREPDPQQAMHWFKLAADQRNPRAHFFLAGLYLRGVLGAVDPSLAFKHTSVAADAGYPDAQFMLANYYLLGVGVEKDLATALKWMRAAAENGDLDAALRLGGMYMTGDSVPQDREQAMYWYCKGGITGRLVFETTFHEPIDCNPK